MKCRLTQALANNVTLPDGKDGEIYWDTDLIGFGLRVRRSGARVIRSWLCTYRHHGQQRRPSISADKVSFADARKWAKQVLAKVQLGEDPQQTKKDENERNERTLKWVAKEFLREKDEAAAKGEIKRRTADVKHHYLLGRRPAAKGKNWRVKLNTDSWLKPLHGVPISKVTLGDISACLVVAEKRSGRASAIALKSITSEMFSWAMQMGYAEQNPVINARKIKSPPSRDRVLSLPELIAIWRACEDDDYGKCVQLLILSSQRRSEIGAIRWSEFDDPENPTIWTLPKQRSKNRLEHVLPVTPMMRDIIMAVAKRDGLRDGLDVLFGFRAGGLTGWSIGKKALDAKLPDLPPWTHHDVRRSVASGLGDLGVPPHVIEEILNHKPRNVQRTYNKSPYASEVRTALLRWQDHLVSLLEDRAPKVVPFERAL
jgi:integrase